MRGSTATSLSSRSAQPGPLKLRERAVSVPGGRLPTGRGLLFRRGRRLQRAAHSLRVLARSLGLVDGQYQCPTVVCPSDAGGCSGEGVVCNEPPIPSGCSLGTPSCVDGQYQCPPVVCPP